jgi:hypothetical protein
MTRHGDGSLTATNLVFVDSHDEINKCPMHCLNQHPCATAAFLNIELLGSELSGRHSVDGNCTVLEKWRCMLVECSDACANPAAWMNVIG